MSTLRILVLVLICEFLIPSPSVSQKRYEYKLRGGNRYEGIKPIGVSAPDLELLSFFSYKEDVVSGTDVNMKIKFFLKSESRVYITAKELILRKFYLMKPLKTNWKTGFQEFSKWPTREVINPLSIKMREIGIVGRISRDRIGSGDVVPLVMYHSESPITVDSYTLVLRPKRALSLIEYTLLKPLTVIVSLLISSPIEAMLTCFFSL